jgi:hypothetical protein
MPDISSMLEVLSDLWLIFSHGGFIVLVIIAMYVLFEQYMNEIGSQWSASQEWIFLSIRVPRANLVSTLAVEQIFTQMHAIHSGISFSGKYIEGKKQLWYSLEIVSLGGKISFMIRAPKKTKDLVEASFFAQYPNAEITEVEDYLKNVEYDPENSAIDLWGTEMKLTDDTSIPIKTYKEFEHNTAEDKIVDPLRPLFEGLVKVQPHELYVVQILIRPLGDDEWRPKGEKVAKALMGEKEAKKTGLMDLLMLPFNLFAEFSFSSLIPQGKSEKKEKTYGTLSEMEKERVNGIMLKISKPGYHVKIRHFYMSPKDKFDGSRKSAMLGAFRTLGSANTNRFKTDGKYTGTSVDYIFSPALEAAYLNHKLKQKKKNMFDGFKKRSFGIGLKPFILNVEEIATIFHLPISLAETTSAPVETIPSRTSQPPANLPIADFD